MEGVRKQSMFWRGFTYGMLAGIAAGAAAREATGQVLAPRAAVSYGEPARTETDLCLPFGDHVALNVGWAHQPGITYTLSVFVRKTTAAASCPLPDQVMVAFGARPAASSGTSTVNMLVEPLFLVPMEHRGDIWGWQHYRLDVPMPFKKDHFVQVAAQYGSLVLTSAGAHITF